MKIFKFLALLPLLCNAMAQEDLGTIMYIGDSITHGFRSGSYRWYLHKIMVDNGIKYKSVGVMKGNGSKGVAIDIIYGRVPFNHLHSAESSARAWEITGNIPAGKTAARFSKSNLNNWLGFSDTTNDGQQYSGNTYKGKNAPNQYFMMIGTNDLLSDNGKNLPNVAQVQAEQLLNNVKEICASMKKANPKAQIVINHIPAFSKGDYKDPKVHQAVFDYHEMLATWAKTQSNIQIININEGLINVCAQDPLVAVTSMMPDGIHPNPQGDLLIAGNMAQAMGWGGRTAGLHRKSTAKLPKKINLEKGKASSFSEKWGKSSGVTIDFHLNFGDGPNNGWADEKMSIDLGNGSQTGTLHLQESGIMWENTVLYSLDNSTNKEHIRVAYVAGDTAQNVGTGFYIWLGDKLIGEALAAKNGDLSGIRFDYGGELPISKLLFSYDPKAAFAPSTPGFYNKKKAYQLKK